MHYNDDAEAAVLGACLLEPDAYGRVMSLLQPGHFHRDFHAAVYALLADMYSNGMYIDLITVTTAFIRRHGPLWQHENVPYLLAQMSINVTSTAHLTAHAALIRQSFLEREMLRIRQEAGKGAAGDPLQAAFDLQEQLNQALSIQAGDDWLDMSQVMLSVDAHRTKVKGKELLGIPAGIPSLDSITAGWQAGQLIIIGARPAVGKTAFAVGIALHAAKNGKKVGIINLEMPEDQLGSRIASIYADVEFWRVYRNRHENHQEEATLAQCMNEMAHLPIYLQTKTSVSSSLIRAKAEKLKRQKGLDLLIIDYLQLIEAEGKASDNREREVARMSRALKLLAMELQIPVIVLAQLNREANKAQGSRPRLENLRESGSLEQDADVVVMLHRDYKVGIEEDEHGQSTLTQAHLLVEKNRNGETGALKISFQPETMKFYEKDPWAALAAPAQRPYQDFTQPKGVDDSPF